MKTNWTRELAPLLKLYGKRKHPLDYENRYQLLVVVLLSAQSTDKLINDISKDFFRTFPDMTKLSKAKPEELYPYLRKVRGFMKKTASLLEIAKIVVSDENIPHTMAELVKLPRVGRKSANVIIRESGDEAEGVICDLHVLRVAPRLGLSDDEANPKAEKVERQIMEAVPQELWNSAGMALSFLGRETCRPTNPDCLNCVMNRSCRYFKDIGGY